MPCAAVLLLIPLAQALSLSPPDLHAHRSVDRFVVPAARVGTLHALLATLLEFGALQFQGPIKVLHRQVYGCKGNCTSLHPKH